MPSAAMESGWAVLFLAGLATAVPLEAPNAFQEALSGVIEVYNQGPRVQNAFRLLEVTPPLGLDATPGTLQQLSFTMQETTCPTSESVEDAEQCELKPDGLMKDCEGYFYSEPGKPIILISCDTVAQEPVRVTRFRGLGGLFKGLSRGFGLWGSTH